MLRRFLYALSCLLAVSSPAVADQTLERVVIVQRHGIRAPTLTADVARYAGDPWPAMPAKPGDLTPHGASVLRTMAANVRTAYLVSGRLSILGCPTAHNVYIRADNSTDRTKESAAAFADGLAPGCNLPVQQYAGPGRDPLFVGLDASVCPFDPERARAAMLAAAGGDLARPGPGYAEALKALEAVVAPDPKLTKTPLLAGPNALTIRDGAVWLSGPLATGAALTEALELTFAEGVPGAGWGRLDAKGLASIMRLHTIFADVLRRPPYVAAHAGAPLAHAVLSALEAPSGHPSAPMPEGDAKLVVFVGHDVNLANMAGLLGVNWTLAGQPDETAPDTAIVIELWRDDLGARTVRFALRYQTLQALQAAGLSEVIPLHVPGCDGENGACTLPAFSKMIADKLPPDCP